MDARRERGHVIAWSDGWEMDVDEVLRLRERGYDVGDEAVAIACNTRGPDKEVIRRDLPRGVRRLGTEAVYCGDNEEGEERVQLGLVDEIGVGW